MGRDNELTSPRLNAPPPAVNLCAGAFRGGAMAKETDTGRGPGGEEHLRFIRNFHDIFLSLGLIMFGCGLAIVAGLVLGQLVKDINEETWRNGAWALLGVSAACAAVMWLLAEVFARSRRLFLPAIVILAFFVFFLSGVIFAGYTLVHFNHRPEALETRISALPSFALWFFGLTSVGIAAYFWRTRLPFAMAALASSIANTAIAGLYVTAPEFVEKQFSLLQLGAGVFLFVLGVVFDARDPKRETLNSDNAFWLHFFAAPLIFYGVMDIVSNAFGKGVGSTAWAAATLGVVVLFAIVSLLINRRALVVAGLLTALVATGILLAKTGLEGSWVVALTLLLLGGAMVLLGGAWHSARKLLIGGFPKTGPISRIIPPEALARAIAPQPFFTSV